jgi:hypothetical protein
MVDRQQIYQAVTLAIVVLFFDTLERRRPGFISTNNRLLRMLVGF